MVTATTDRRLVRAAAVRARSRSTRMVRRSVHDRGERARVALALGEESRVHVRRLAPDGAAHITVAVRAGRLAPQRVRRALEQELAPLLPGPVLADIALMTTELVTNAVLHGRSGDGRAISVCARAAAGTVMVRVVDQGSGFDPAAPRRAPGALGGWGLGIVEQLSAAWGAARSSAGWSVWFRVRYAG